MPLCLYALENPFVECMHPQAEALRVYGRMWIQRVGLVKTPAELERFDAALYWQLIAEAYPEAPWEILSLAHDWSCWGFYLDDFDDSTEASSQPGALRSLFEGIRAVLRNAPISKDAPIFLQVVDNIWQRMYFYSSNEWRSRFASTLSESLSAYQWEAQNRLTQHVPAVAEYMDYRRKTGGWRTLVLLVDLAIGRTLPEQFYSNPLLQQLLDTANNIICWSNDLFSFEKEQAVGEIHNLIPVVQVANQCSVGEAMQTIVDWHNQEVQRWQTLVQQLPRWSLSPREAYHVQRYIQFCEHYIYANHVWSQESGRYRRRAAVS